MIELNGVSTAAQIMDNWNDHARKAAEAERAAVAMFVENWLKVWLMPAVIESLVAEIRAGKHLPKEQ